MTKKHVWKSQKKTCTKSIILYFLIYKALLTVGTAQ